MITWDELKRRENRRKHRIDLAELEPVFDVAEAALPKKSAVDWSQGTVTRGGGVAATIAAIRRTRGPNRNPTKEQVAIRFDREVLNAFRAGGPGWQTRMNAALKEWLAAHPAPRKGDRA